MIRNTRWFFALLVFASLISHDLLIASDAHAVTTVQRVHYYRGDRPSMTNTGMDNEFLAVPSGQAKSGDRAVTCSAMPPWTTSSQKTDVLVALTPPAPTVSDRLVTRQVSYPPDPPGYPANVLRALLQVYRN